MQLVVVMAVRKAVSAATITFTATSIIFPFFIVVEFNRRHRRPLLDRKSVEDVNKVKTSLISSRRIIFTPSVDLKDELADTAIQITCYDRNGDIVKRVTSADDGIVEDPENTDNGGGTENGGGTNTGNGGTNTGGNTGGGGEVTGDGDGD